MMLVPKVDCAGESVSPSLCWPLPSVPTPVLASRRLLRRRSSCGISWRDSGCVLTVVDDFHILLAIRRWQRCSLVCRVRRGSRHAHRRRVPATVAPPITVTVLLDLVAVPEATAAWDLDSALPDLSRVLVFNPASPQETLRRIQFAAVDFPLHVVRGKLYFQNSLGLPERYHTSCRRIAHDEKAVCNQLDMREHRLCKMAWVRWPMMEVFLSNNSSIVFGVR